MIFSVQKLSAGRKLSIEIVMEEPRLLIWRLISFRMERSNIQVHLLAFSANPLFYARCLREGPSFKEACISRNAAD